MKSLKESLPHPFKTVVLKILKIFSKMLGSYKFVKNLQKRDGRKEKNRWNQ